MNSGLLKVFLLFLPIVGTAHARNLCTETFIANGIDSILSQKDLESTAVKNCFFLHSDNSANSRWNLVWQDEFEYKGKPDPQKWKYETGKTGWGNDEEQNYTDRIENSYTEDGTLVIKAIKEKHSGGKSESTYTSARLNSKESFTYGRFEFRVRIPTGLGLWPAAWLLADKQVYGKALWPDNGEIDVMEAVGYARDNNITSAHTSFHRPTSKHQQTKYNIIFNQERTFHTYAVEWLPKRLDFYIDDERVHTIYKDYKDGWEKWPFDQDFHIIMNLAVGGAFGGARGINEHSFPAKLEVEYVRVFRPANIKDCL